MSLGAFTTSIYAQRRENLIELLKREFGEKGLVVLFAGFENEGVPFLQESNFYYFSGINEPGTVMLFDLSGKTEIYIPNTNGLRAKWVAGALSPGEASNLGVNEIKYLGSPITGYEPKPFIEAQNYADLLNELQKAIVDGSKIFTITKNRLEQVFVWNQLCFAYICLVLL